MQTWRTKAHRKVGAKSWPAKAGAPGMLPVVGSCQTRLRRIVKVMLDYENEMGDGSCFVR